MAGKVKTNEVILKSPNGLQEATLSLSDSGVVSSDKKVNLASDTTFNSLPMFACRAWVTFDGTGTNGTNQTILASGNVSSVYKNGTGDYTINFTTPMVDANYAVSGISPNGDNSVQFQVKAPNYYSLPTLKTTTQLEVVVCQSTGTTTYFNAKHIMVMIFR